MVQCVFQLVMSCVLLYDRRSVISFVTSQLSLDMIVMQSEFKIQLWYLYSMFHFHVLYVVIYHMFVAVYFYRLIMQQCSDVLVHICLSVCLSVCVCLSVELLTVESFDLESLFFICGYIFIISRSYLDTRVIGSRSPEEKHVCVCVWLRG